MRNAREISRALVAIGLLTGCSSANPPVPAAPARPAPTTNPPTQSTSDPARPQQARPTTGPRPFREVIPANTPSDSGLFTVYRTSDDKVFFQIPDSLMLREFLLISRWARVPSNFGGTSPAGFSVQEQVITFEKRGQRVMLRKQSYDQVAEDTTPIAVSVLANNFAPIVASFPVAAIGPDSNSVLVDVTEFYKGDTPAISGLDPARRRTYGVRRLDPDRSFINHARSFPLNVEVRHTQTF